MSPSKVFDKIIMAFLAKLRRKEWTLTLYADLRFQVPKFSVRSWDDINMAFDFECMYCRPISQLFEYQDRCFKLFLIIILISQGL